MNWKLLVVLLIAPLLYYQPAMAQKQRGIINDPDGFVNLRSDKGTNYEVVKEIRESERFEYIPDNSNWWPVTTNNGLHGFMHKSKIQLYSLDYKNACPCRHHGMVENEIALAGKIGNHDISICGYLLQRNSYTKIKISEFTIYDCSKNEQLAFYGALDECYVEFTEGELIVIGLIGVPSGKGWKWERAPIYKITMSEAGDQIKSSEKANVFSAPSISPAEIANLNKEALKIKESGEELLLEELENYMGRLFVGAMKGNVQSKEILINYKDYFGVIDGILSEMRSTYMEYLELYGLQ
jgi:hypothetical protein